MLMTNLKQITLQMEEVQYIIEQFKVIAEC